MTPGKVYRLKTSGIDHRAVRSFISRNCGYLFVYIGYTERGSLFRSVSTGRVVSIPEYHFEQGEDDGWQEEQA